MAAFGAASAVAAGEVTGLVTDEGQVRSLPGAEIELVELQRNTESAPNGAFRFSGVPAGNYTLRARYSGAAPYSTTITVTETGVVTVNVPLSGGGEANGQILVVGQRASLASSISRQRASDTVESVLTRDGIGQFPDQNAAEAVRRAPGVNVLNDQGEGRFVAVRGLAPDLNAASINGVRVTAPESDVRSVALDVIPADLIESIEIQKSLTPDMDADSLGGSININTTKASDRRKPFLAIRAEGSYNDLSEEWSPLYAVDFSKTFDKLGIAGGLSYNNRKFSTDNVEADGWSDEGGAIFADTLEYRDYDVERKRIGGTLSFDYELSANTTLFARGLYSKFEDQEYRNSLTFEQDANSLVSGGPNGASFQSGREYDDDGSIENSEISVTRALKDRFEEQTISSYVLGGLTETNGWTLRYEASYSLAKEQERGSLDPTEFALDFAGDALDPELGVTFDYANWRKPGYTIGVGADTFLDPSEYELNEIARTTKSDAEDEEIAFRFDAGKEFALDQGAFELKGGIRGRFREKTYDADIDYFENDSVTLADFLGSQSYGLADIEPVAAPGPIRDYFTANFADFERNIIDSAFDSLIEDFKVKEDISAAYMMGRYDRGPVRLIGGLRVENTRQTVAGNFVELVEEGETYSGAGSLAAEDGDAVYVTQTGFKNDYTDWLPSLNLRFDARDDLVMRAGVYRSVLRPKPGQIAPRFVVEQTADDGREGEFGNPGLKPYKAWNYDATLEWYFGKNSVLQGGVFYKEIKDFIVDFEADGSADDPFGGAFNGVAYDEAIIPINGDKATVFGVELGYAQALDFLPGLLSGLVLSANYTYTDSEGDVLGRKISLPASSENTVNFQIGYDKGPLDVRFAISYRDGYLDELGGDESEDRMVEDHIQYDLTVKYDLTDKIQLYSEFVNLGDEPYVAYQTGPDGRKHLLQYEEYSWTGKLGLRARF